MCVWRSEQGLLTEAYDVMKNVMQGGIAIRYYEVTAGILAALAIFSFCACRHPAVTVAEDAIVKSVGVAVSDSVTNLSSILSVKRVIPLETQDSSLIGGNIWKIFAYKNHIYVSFNRNTLLQFDRQGKFVRQIGSVGGGPGEYATLRDFDVTEEGVYILSHKGILHYDCDGRFLHAIPAEISLSGIKVAGDKILGFVTREKHVSYVLDREGHVLDSALPASPITSMAASSYYWPYQGNEYLFPLYQTNEALLYDAAKGSYAYVRLIDLPDAMTLERGNKLFEEKGLNIYLGEYGTILWAFNSNGTQLQFQTFEDEDDKGTLWVRKVKEGKTLAFDCARIRNDVTFVPLERFFSSFMQADSSFFSRVDPTDLKEALMQPQAPASPYYRPMKALADSLGEEDNPVLIEYEFK